MSRIRRASQLFFLALTLLLLVCQWGLPFLMQASPLALLSASLASKRLLFGWGWGFLLLALPLGRFFCGWICPLGTLHHLASRRFRRPFPGSPFKYFLLGALLFLAGTGLNLAGYFDPLSILVRSSAFLKAFLGGARWQGWLLLPLFVILLANLFRSRLWCRLFCPLGALLGLASWLWPKGNREGCTHCGLCSRECPQGLTEGWLSAECILCGRCHDRCPKGALKLGPAPRFAAPKREFFALLLLALGGLLPWKRREKKLRPPGATADFLGRCVRCGACLQVCPSRILFPDLALEGLLAPQVQFLQGYCEPDCTRCGQACPTGAIQRLSACQKKRAPIGLARVDRLNCRECLQCVSACPNGALSHFPGVDAALCTGCGKCEWTCPAAAIKVYPRG